MAAGRFVTRALGALLGVAIACALGNVALAQPSAIGSATVTQNQVSRELNGATSALATGDSVYLNELVKTGEDSRAKFVFIDSTNLAVGPVSRVTLDRFVYEGAAGAQKVTVNLAKGLFRFTTGALDKKAYTINTPTAAIGVRGTILDIKVGGETRVTLVEGQAIVCARKGGMTLEQQIRACGKALAGGSSGGGHCDCVALNNAGQTAQAKKGHAGYSATPVETASLCSGDVCSETSYASNGSGSAGGGALCGR
jgi:hypothetical protein